MERYIIIYTLGASKVKKEIDAVHIDDAAHKAAHSDNWPDEFVHNFENMEAFVSKSSDVNKALRWLSYNEMSRM